MIIIIINNNNSNNNKIIIIIIINSDWCTCNNLNERKDIPDIIGSAQLSTIPGTAHLSLRKMLYF